MRALPWSPRSPQSHGDRVEAEVARSRGLRRHPRSGAGKIKMDASDGATVAEIKSAAKSITLTGEKLRADMVRAHHAGRDLVWVIRFGDARIEAEVTVRPVRP